MKTPKLTEHLKSLITGFAEGNTNEAMVQNRLVKICEELGRDCQIAQSVEGGMADIHLTDCNVIIECKASGKVGPTKPGSTRQGQQAKTQFRQLANYVEGMIRQQAILISSTSTGWKPWTGILTDGKKWWAWRWDNGTTPKASEPFATFEIVAGETRVVYSQLVKLLYDEKVKGMLRWVPEDMASMFQGEKTNLEQVYELAEGSRDVQNKQEIWHSLAKGSGIAPEGNYKSHRLFILHSYLVVVARAVICALTSKLEDANSDLVLKDGFVSWVLKTNAGREWTQRIFKEAFQFDWRMRATDVLRQFYEHVIPKSDRKLYGEYYTPDWVAAMLTERILDAKWLTKAVKAWKNHDSGKSSGLKNIGVLDPACGSGTFLYHSALLIRKAPAIQALDAQSQADCIAQLVHGIDIHPVAVEMSKATLLRALPVPPTGGARALNISQGDSLLSSVAAQLLDQASFPSEAERLFSLPMEFLLLEDYRNRTEILVKSAQQGDKKLPDSAIAGLSMTKKKLVVVELNQAHQRLRELCLERGDGIWLWLVVNTIAPLRLCKRKVDRIIANPPWVRMNEIRVQYRKKDLEELARNLNLWVGGKDATGFDIGALFVKRCRELYGTNKDFTAAWVLNWASIQGSNWQKFRDWSKNEFTGIIDFSEIRNPPFSGAKSAVWLQQSGLASSSNYLGQLKHEVMKLKSPSEKIQLTDSWGTAKAKSVFGQPQQKIPEGPSEYINGERIRNGATLFPHVLVRIAEVSDDGKRAKFTTKKSNKGVWATVTERRGEIPLYWVKNAVYSEDLLPFCLKAQPSKVILPLSKSGTILTKPTEDYWQSAEKLYQEHAGLGSYTPQTLLQQIDHMGKLSQQLPLNKNVDILVYNAAGQYLRAAACKGNVVFENQTYWLMVANKKEAIFLATILNAPSLKMAFAQARKSDRHFHTHFWRCVPIPRFLPQDELHSKLVKLGMRASTIAVKTRNNLSQDAKQIQASTLIRKALTSEGVFDEIDKAVRLLLPKQASK